MLTFEWTGIRWERRGYEIMEGITFFPFGQDSNTFVELQGGSNPVLKVGEWTTKRKVYLSKNRVLRGDIVSVSATGAVDVNSDRGPVAASVDDDSRYVSRAVRYLYQS